jgi:formamidopyrimidine-DNA glycosylase
MPELPEVQSIVNTLRLGHDGTPSIIGQTITHVHVFWERTIAEPDLNTFTHLIPGQVVKDIKRRGKFVHILLDKGHLLMHLRMSGDLLMETIANRDDLNPLRRHDRVIFEFSSGWQLAFIDPRKFGRIWLTDEPENQFKRLGPEPFDPDLTPDRLFSLLSRSKKKIKPLLMNQSFLVGLGNIYTDESLFLAKIHPLRKANELSLQEVESLLLAIRQVLEQAIIRNGTSIDWVYRGGTNQNHLKVYQKDGTACVVCGTLIKRSVIGQRGTHFCPVCQPLITKG